MANRAFTTGPTGRAALALTLLLSVLASGVASPSGSAVAAADTRAATSAATSATGTGDELDDDTTRPTINEFFPEERPLSDCLSSLPKPDCGSEARGGWAQTTVFAAILAGLAFIAWRIVASARRARRSPPTVTSGTPGPTTVPDGDGGAPPP